MRTIAFAVLSVLVVVPAVAAGRQIGTYVYDGSGNVKSILGEPYRYDAFGRLVRATVEGREQVVAYDRYGNISSIRMGGGSEITFGVDPDTNRVTDDTKNVFATYDDAGRLTAELGGAGNTFTYDSLDTVTHSRVDGAAAVHLYAANDERLASVTVLSGGEGPSEWTLRDEGGRVRRRLRKSGTAWSWERDYIHGSGSIIAAEAIAGQTLHFFPDYLGTPRLITGNGGTRVALHTYLPFGDEITEPAQDEEKLKFTGHERDSQSLDYMHARYYHPRWGRFLSVDPANVARKTIPQSWNRYSYALNNPLRFVDPDGRCSVPAGLREGLVGICIQSFIAARRIGGIGFGDNRGFAPNDPDATFRTSYMLVLNPKTGKAVSESVDAGVSEAGFSKPFIAVKGQSTVQGGMLQGPDGVTRIALYITGKNGLAALNAFGTIGFVANLSVDSNGKVSADPTSRTKGYPSIEGYAYRMVEGRVVIEVIFKREEDDPSDLTLEMNQPLKR